MGQQFLCLYLEVVLCTVVQLALQALAGKQLAAPQSEQSPKLGGGVETAT
jgi:hypothetical protein